MLSTNDRVNVDPQHVISLKFVIWKAICLLLKESNELLLFSALIECIYNLPPYSHNTCTGQDHLQALSLLLHYAIDH